MTQTTGPLSNVHEEAARLLDHAAERDVSVRAVGGLAVWMLCESARVEPLSRPAKDIDLVGLGSQRERIERLLVEGGYVPDREFNLYHGHVRMIFYDERHQRNLDVFLDELNMCHSLALKDRIGLAERTLTPADLLLTKLQIVAFTTRDLKDSTALFADCAIDADRVAEVLAGDWGWWRTATGNLDKVGRFATEVDLDHTVRARVLSEIESLRSAITNRKKTAKWRMRARVGERVRWYEVPEESVSGTEA